MNFKNHYKQGFALNTKPHVALIFMSLLWLAFSCTNTYEPDIEEPIMPVACFSVNNSGALTDTCTLTFNNCSENALWYQWYFGDGTESNQPNPTHGYSKMGSYTVLLVAKNNTGCDSIKTTIEITEAFTNHIIWQNTKLELNKAMVLTDWSLGKMRKCVLLSAKTNNIVNDSISGVGIGLKLEFDVNDASKSEANRNSYVYILSDTNAAVVKKSLEGALVSHTFYADSLIVDISTPEFVIHFGGHFNNGSFNYQPTLTEIQQFINSTQNPRAKNTFAQYELLLNELSNSRYVVLPINEMIHYYNPDKIVVGMRHDVDCHPFKAIEMAKLEQQRNIRSSFYILATAAYYGKINTQGAVRYTAMYPVYQQLYDMGCEIGIHNDLIAIMLQYGLDPFEFNQDELAFYRQLGIPINGTVAHGSYLASITVKNFNVFSDFAKESSFTYNGKTYPLGQHSLAEYGFDYEANFIDFNVYFSESGGVWNVNNGLDQVISTLQNLNLGTRVQILTHPVWWGKE